MSINGRTGAKKINFNKTARALQFLLWHDFGVVTTNFYEDYPTIEFSSAAQHTTGVVSGFFQLLGWGHAAIGKKATPFATMFAALGVKYDLSNIQKLPFKVRNKPDRLLRIERMIQQASQSEKLGTSTAASIHGLLNFASSYALGKALQPATGLSRPPGAFSDLYAHALAILKSLQPRVVSAHDVQTPVTTYTDGAFGGDLADWGSILIDPVDRGKLPPSSLAPSCW